MTLVLAPSAAAMLARASLFDDLAAVPDEVLLAEPTYERLVAAEPERPGATAVVNAGEADAFRVVPVSDADRFERLRANDRLADADAAAVALADLVGGLVVTDETYLHETAAAETVPTATLPTLLLTAVSNGDLPAARALDGYDALQSAGWAGRPDLYAAFISALDARRS